MKMDLRHAMVSVAARDKQQPAFHEPDKRRIYTNSTSAITIPRPLVRRGSLDASSVLRSGMRHPQSFRRESSSSDMRERRNSANSASILRRQVSVPPATRISSVKRSSTEIKSILKTSSGSNPSSPTSSASGSKPESSKSVQKPTESPDVKFQYRLPNRPTIKLRKSVSFKEDDLHSRKSYTKNYSAPILSLPDGVYSLDRMEDTVIHL